ncbi:hypothetical protein [Chitinophaga sp. RAB17]|uniref:hypothetical protein n=1 Tax=Chitinophaga sp. RAB17 TaxID=3233049 RepID=UPI003F8E0899
MDLLIYNQVSIAQWNNMRDSSMHRFLIFNKIARLFLIVIFNLFFIRDVKSQAMTDRTIIKAMNTYCLGDSIDHYKGFIPIKAVEKKLNVSLSFFPFRIDYLLAQEFLPAEVQHLGVSVLNGNIAGVYLLLPDTSNLLSILETEYGRYDMQFNGIGDGYSYEWRKKPCIKYTNTTTPVTSHDKKTVISLYLCDKLKQITLESFSKYIKD